MVERLDLGIVPSYEDPPVEERVMHEIISGGKVVERFSVPFRPVEYNQLGVARIIFNGMDERDKAGIEIPTDYGLKSRQEAMEAIFLTYENINLALNPGNQRRIMGGNNSRNAFALIHEALAPFITQLPSTQR